MHHDENFQDSEWKRAIEYRKKQRQTIEYDRACSSLKYRSINGNNIFRSQIKKNLKENSATIVLRAS